MRFFFHLHECGDNTTDEEGRECADLDYAIASATEAAREVMCAEVTEGRLCLACYIVIEDGEHREVSRVLFRDAVNVTGLRATGGLDS